MNRDSWLMFFALGLFAGLGSVAIASGLLFAWLVVWPIAWLAEFVRSRWPAAIVLGYFASVGIRVLIGFSLALILDRILNDELGANRIYWFGWLLNYLLALIVETILLMRPIGRTGNENS